MTTKISGTWWKTYFSEIYGNLYRGPLAGDLDTEGEVQTLESIFQEVDGPVLDLCCGHGRHLEPLRKTGVPVFGVDWSIDLIGMIRRKNQRYVARGDARRLPFRDAAFGGAYLLFNSFGYFSDEDNILLLKELRRVLKRGAPFILDAPVRAGMRAVVRELPVSARVQEEMEIDETWGISEDGNRLLGSGTWRIGEQGQPWELTLRLYTPGEIARLLAKAGFSHTIETRPLGEFGLLGQGLSWPEPKDSKWRRATNLCALALA